MCINYLLVDCVTLELYLIFINFTVLKLSFSLLLKCNNNQGHEYVYEEKWKYNEIYDIENGHFDAKILYWSLIIVRSCHRMLKNSVVSRKTKKEQQKIGFRLENVSSKVFQSRKIVYIGILLWPSFSGLHSKQCKHRRSHIVIMKTLCHPSSPFFAR